MTDLFDELRIIAKDARLETRDKAVIAVAADEMERLCRDLILTNAALIESQAHRIALNETLLDIRRKQLAVGKFTFPTLSTGWIKVEVR